MKRIGAILLSVVLLLSCAVPAGAYHWSGQSFLEDYYEMSLLSLEYEDGHFSLGDFDFSASVEVEDYSHIFDFSSSSFSTGGLIADTILYGSDSRYSSLFPVNGSGPSGRVTASVDSFSFPFIFNFDSPVSSFSLFGGARLSFNLYCSFFSSSTSTSASLGSLGSIFPDSVDVLVDSTLVQRFPISSGSSFVDFSGVSFSSSSISSFSLVFHFSGPFVVYRNVYSFRGVSCTYHLYSQNADSAFEIHSVPASTGPVDPDSPDPPGPVDPDPPEPPGPVDPDSPDPIVPGEGDFSYTVVEGEKLAEDVVLSSSTRTGGANVYWIYDSYETGNPLYPVTVPGGSALSMAPSRFPSISLSSSSGTVTASISSTSYSFSWSGDQRVDSFVNLLTGPPGFSGPGSAAHDYLVFQIPLASQEEIHNIELDGFIPVETSYRAGGSSASRVGGSWSLYVNGALAVSGTTDISGNIQFNNFVYHSSESITSLELRLVPTAASLAFPSNTGSITFSWSVSLGMKGLSMIYTEGEDSVVDLSKLYGQINDAQDSIHDYETIENQWIDNMSSNWDALKLDTFALDTGLVSGFALLTGIFNDIWTSFGIFNVVWVVPLLLGIALLVIGRISRSGGTGKEGQ